MVTIENLMIEVEKRDKEIERLKEENDFIIQCPKCGEKISSEDMEELEVYRASEKTINNEKKRLKKENEWLLHECAVLDGTCFDHGNSTLKEIQKEILEEMQQTLKKEYNMKPATTGLKPTETPGDWVDL